jgi:hypothetical protein
MTSCSEHQLQLSQINQQEAVLLLFLCYNLPLHPHDSLDKHASRSVLCLQQHDQPAQEHSTTVGGPQRY